MLTDSIRQKYRYLLLLGIFLLGLAVRIYFFQANRFIGNDGVMYARLGENLIKSGQYSFGENFNFGILFTPGYPISIGLVNLLVRDIFMSGKLVSLIFGLSSIILFYFLGKELAGIDGGLFSAMCFSFYPYISANSALVLSDSQFFFFFFASLYISLIYQRTGKLWQLLAFSITSAIAFLTKPEGLVLLVLPLLFRNTVHIQKTKYWLMIAGVFILFFAIAAPYTVFLSRTTGKLTLSGKASLNMIKSEFTNSEEEEVLNNALSEDKSQLDIFKRSRETEFISYLLHDPLNVIKRYLKNLAFEVKLLFFLCLPVGLPLLLSFLRKNAFRNRPVHVLGFITAILFIVLPFFYLETRYLYTIVLMFLLLSLSGFAEAKEQFNTVTTHYECPNNSAMSFLKKHVQLVCVAVFLILAVPLHLYGSGSGSSIPSEHVMAASFLRSSLGDCKDVNVMSKRPWISFYSGSKYTNLPMATPDEIVSFARNYRVNYVVIDKRLLGTWQQYDDLLHLEKFAPYVTPFYESKDSLILRIFKVEY